MLWFNPGVNDLKQEELVSIGKVCGTHGYRGVVKVLPLTDFPERFQDLKKVLVDKKDGLVELSVESVNPYKSMLLITFAEINTKEEAQEYFNCLLKVSESEIYLLPDGYYYHFQLLGMAVYDINRGFLGELKEILETGANDVYVVNGPSYGEILIPAIKEVIVAVNVAENKMQVDLLPGLIDSE